MKKVGWMAVLVAGLGASLWIQSGCVVAGVGAAGVGVAAYERHKRHANYEAYQEEMETVNKERAVQGLPPEPVLSFREWKAERSRLKLPAEKAP